MNNTFELFQVDKDQAKSIAIENYGIYGDVKSLPGELDSNFFIRSESNNYLLKISRPDVDSHSLDFQQQMVAHVRQRDKSIRLQEIIPDLNGNKIANYIDKEGSSRPVRLFNWIDGRLWSSVNPIKKELLESLGKSAGSFTQSLQGFDHPYAKRKFDWDIAQADWCKQYFHLYDDDKTKIVERFFKRFEEIYPQYKNFRKSVVHNDANDNNILVSADLISPTVISIIDYGDAIFTQSINDLAIAIAYAAMHKTDPLTAACHVVCGYHQSFPLREAELSVLYTLIAMRLIISVTKSAINREKEPENRYLLISEKPAWNLLKKWSQIDGNEAHYRFREACGLSPHPQGNDFYKWAVRQHRSIRDLFPGTTIGDIVNVDLGLASEWLGNRSEFEDNDQFSFKLAQLVQNQKNAVIGGGYHENRAFYTTELFRSEGNNGPEYRTVHLAVDFWMAPDTAVAALFDGIVFSAFDNAGEKDYGPTIILKHRTDDGLTFFTLYGHLSEESLDLHRPGREVKRGEKIAHIGAPPLNGNWAPHLHFQIILDMLSYHHDFPGVAKSSQIDFWSHLCPDPNLFFREKALNHPEPHERKNILAARTSQLGKSLSLSYDNPLYIVRGSGTYLIEANGRKYLDTVNNVAHVGHEHPRVVAAGQRQMAVLNTNTRYLHEKIIEFSQALLKTFPPELSVVHFVNSGSEANELAMRMVKSYTNENDMIALETGYHGNTNACIDISSYKFDGKGGRGCPEFTHIVPLPDAFRGLYRGKDSGPDYAGHVQKQIDNIVRLGRKPATFICESIMSCGGQIELPEGFLKMTYESVRNAGGLCISDEVQVGLGRVGSHFWGFQLHDVIPDIVTIGKPLGNGHPLAAVVCTAEVADAFANGMEYFNTFGGNPVSCAIGLEVLRVIREEQLQENALKVGAYLVGKLKQMQKSFPIIGDIRGKGLFLGMELTDEHLNPMTEKAVYLANRMRELGILMSTDGKDNNVLKIKPPIVFSRENADELCRRLETVFKENYMQA